MRRISSPRGDAMLLSHDRVRLRPTMGSFDASLISRNAVALVAMTIALTIGAVLAYVLLDGALGLITVLLTVELASLLVLTALLLLLGIYRVPVIATIRSVFRRGTASIVCVAIAAGMAVTLARPFQAEGIALLLLSCILTLTSVLRAAVTGRLATTGNSSLGEAQRQGQAISDGFELHAVMQHLARDVVNQAEVHAYRVFTVSSDRGALVLRGEATRDSLATAQADGPPRERIPVQQLPWLERLLQRNAWLDVPAEIVATDGIGHELTRSLTPAAAWGDLSLRALHIAGNPVGVVCLIHTRNASSAARIRQQRTSDGIIDAAKDTIERTLRLRSLGVRADRWSAVMLELPYGVAIVNRGTRLVGFNTAAERATATPAGDVLGRRLCRGSATCRCPLHVTLRTDESRQIPLRSFWPFPLSPAALDQLVNIWPISNANDDPELAVIALSTAAGSEPAPTFGTEVAAMISHELRAPLATLRASSELALEEIDDPERHRGLLTTITRQVDRLDHLVQDLADVFRLQSGKLQLHREALDVVGLCHELVEDLDQTKLSRRIEVRAEASVQRIAADRLKVRTVINNLVSNAIKYAPEDTPIRITVADVDDRLHVTVADHGPGIAEGDRPHIFEQFYRSRSATSTSPGYGLGLYITRALVELHGGRIWVECGNGHGCRFTFTLPRQPDMYQAAYRQAG